MKAVVLEIRNGNCAVMTDEGEIKKIKNSRYEIGQEIVLSNSGNKIVSFTESFRKFAPAVAAAMFMVMAGGGTYIYNKPYGVVSLDVNPSIEYTINRIDRVIEVNGVNDDGNAILSQLEIKNILNKTVEKAVDETIEQIKQEGYFSDTEENYVVIAANTEKEEHTDKLVAEFDEELGEQEEISFITMKVSDDEIEEAHKQGISAGKKMMVDKLVEEGGDEIDRKEWNEKSVREIVVEYDKRKNEKNLPATNGENKNDDGSVKEEPMAEDRSNGRIKDDITGTENKVNGAGKEGTDINGTDINGDTPVSKDKPAGGENNDNSGTVTDKAPAQDNLTDKTNDRQNKVREGDTPVIQDDKDGKNDILEPGNMEQYGGSPSQSEILPQQDGGNRSGITDQTGNVQMPSGEIPQSGNDGAGTDMIIQSEGGQNMQNQMPPQGGQR
ncbi:MAG: anti-sigma factor domain-containing protein [Lachnospiraceae bacterium]|nr:anti-sigma factor domain-containing protein [Lachnospiraceae bacterium]